MVCDPAGAAGAGSVGTPSAGGWPAASWAGSAGGARGAAARRVRAVRWRSARWPVGGRRIEARRHVRVGSRTGRRGRSVPAAGAVQRRRIGPVRTAGRVRTVGRVAGGTVGRRGVHTGGLGRRYVRAGARVRVRDRLRMVHGYGHPFRPGRSRRRVPGGRIRRWVRDGGAGVGTGGLRAVGAARAGAPAGAGSRGAGTSAGRVGPYRRLRIAAATTTAGAGTPAGARSVDRRDRRGPRSPVGHRRTPRISGGT